jgi:hypothetical protein
MQKILDLTRSRIDGAASRAEVEEELRFHLEMCARDYLSQGCSPEESQVLARERFGDLSAIKRQCVQISLRKNVRVRAMRIFCAMILVLGISVSIAAADSRIARIGQVLIIIALMGALLTLVKTVSALHLVSDKKLLRLGLDNSDSTT